MKKPTSPGKWRPIKTAPKDQLILLADPQSSSEYPWLVLPGRWIEVPHTNEMIASIREQRKPQQIDGWMGCYPAIMRHSHGNLEGLSFEERGIFMRPTHWMPMPKPSGRLQKQSRVA